MNPRFRWSLLLSGLFLTQISPVCAATIQFSGFEWSVRSGRGGPGPNTWDEKNVWLDSSGFLHLKISCRDERWSCAEVTMRRRLGFGRYQFQTTGRIDAFDDNAVLGLFNYPTADAGTDGTHEIDIEFARWGEAKNPMGNFTVWPVEKTLKQTTKGFAFTLENDQATHRFTWGETRVLFKSLQGHRNDDLSEFGRWVYSPEDAPRRISQKPMPVHINLWLFRGHPPKNGKEVEVIVRSFEFTPGP